MGGANGARTSATCAASGTSRGHRATQSTRVDMATSPAPTRLDAISPIDHNHVGLASQDVSYCSHPRFCLFLLCIRSFACKKIEITGFRPGDTATDITVLSHQTGTAPQNR